MDENTDSKQYHDDTTKEEVTHEGTNHIIHHNQKEDVNCKLKNGSLEFFDIKTGTKVEMEDKVHHDDIYMPKSRSPSGKYWKFDCTIFQKMIFDNCWEGDNGKGDSCTFWDRYVFHTKCYDLSAIQVSMTLATTMTAIGISALI